MSYGPGPGQPPPNNGGWGAPPPPPGGPPPGGPPGGPPPPPPPGPQQGNEQPASQGNSIGALIANAIGLFCCCGGTLPGLILAIIGLTMVNNNPKASRGCTLAAWIWFGLSVLGAIVYVILIFALGWDSPGYYGYYDYDTTY